MKLITKQSENYEKLFNNEGNCPVCIITHDDGSNVRCISNEEYFDNERPKTMATRAASYAGEPGETGNTNAVPRYFAKGKFPIHLFHLEDEIDTCSVSFMFHADEHGILTDTVLTFNNEALLNPEVVVAKPALVNRKMYFKIQIRGQMEKDNTTYSVSGEKYGEVTNVEILTGR